jgi:hypothetical protein
MKWLRDRSPPLWLVVLIALALVLFGYALSEWG